MRDFEAICKIVLRALKAQKAEDSEQMKATSDEMLTHEYNYLSEYKFARDTLFEVCVLDDRIGTEDKRMLHDSKEAYDNLFK